MTGGCCSCAWAYAHERRVCSRSAVAVTPSGLGPEAGRGHTLLLRASSPRVPAERARWRRDHYVYACLFGGATARVVLRSASAVLQLGAPPLCHHPCTLSAAGPGLTPWNVPVLIFLLGVLHTGLTDVRAWQALQVSLLPCVCLCCGCSARPAPCLECCSLLPCWRVACPFDQSCSWQAGGSARVVTVPCIVYCPSGLQ